MRCCICGKKITDQGNNPSGVLTPQGKLMKWKPEDRCCDSCNEQYVIPGRLITSLKIKNKIL